MRKFALLLLLLATLILIAVFFVQYSPNRVGPPRMSELSCRYRIEEVSYALLSYRDTFGRYPPSFSIDKEGKPLHSWRVHLLSFYQDPDFKKLSKQIRFNEPWNSQHNMEIFENAKTPYIYQCPWQSDSKETNFLMVVGSDTISNGSGHVRKQDVSDGIENTAAIVECANTGIRWFEPRDFSVADARLVINGPTELEPSSFHERGRCLTNLGGSHILFMDGKVYFMLDTTSPQTIRALTTIAGGEIVKTDSLLYRDGKGKKGENDKKHSGGNGSL